MNRNQLIEIVPSYRFHCHIIAVLFKKFSSYVTPLNELHPLLTALPLKLLYTNYTPVNWEKRKAVTDTPESTVLCPGLINCYGRRYWGCEGQSSHCSQHAFRNPSWKSNGRNAHITTIHKYYISAYAGNDWLYVVPIVTTIRHNCDNSWLVASTSDNQ